jgi:hypothetical protein
LLENIQPKEEMLEALKMNIQIQAEARDKNKDLFITAHKINLRSVDDKIQRFIERV